MTLKLENEQSKKKFSPNSQFLFTFVRENFANFGKNRCLGEVEANSTIIRKEHRYKHIFQ